MTNSQNIIMVDIGRIRVYPIQEEVYGEFDPASERTLIESVRDSGVLTPITITAQNILGDEDGYDLPIEDCICVSGHRRLFAAREAGLEKVPCIEMFFDNREESDITFFTMNFNREKTDAQRMVEFLRLKGLLTQAGKSKRIMNLSQYFKETYDSISRILDLGKFAGKIDYEESVDTIGVIKKITGYSKYEQEMLNIVLSDEYIGDKMLSLERSGVPHSKTGALFNAVLLLRKEYRAGKITLNAAAVRIKDWIAELKGARKKKATSSAKPGKSEREDDDAGDGDSDKLPLMHGIAIEALADITLQMPLTDKSNLKWCLFTSGASGLIYDNGKHAYSVSGRELAGLLEEFL